MAADRLKPAEIRAYFCQRLLARNSAQDVSCNLEGLDETIPVTIHNQAIPRPASSNQSNNELHRDPDVTIQWRIPLGGQ